MSACKCGGVVLINSLPSKQNKKKNHVSLMYPCPFCPSGFPSICCSCLCKDCYLVFHELWFASSVIINEALV